MWKELKPADLLFALLSVVTGLVYPFVVTGIAQAAFPRQAGGDTDLIGQPFASPGYFWSRPSATSPYPYNAASSSGFTSSTAIAPSKPSGASTPVKR